MKKIFTIFLMFIFLYNVSAYENDYFKMDVPNNFKEVKLNESGIYKWENGNENIVITLSKNNLENKYDIEYYTEDDLEKYRTEIEKGINEQIKQYNITVKVSNVKKEKLNGVNTISYETFWPTKESIGNDIYQKGHSFTSNNYVYVYTFTSDKRITDDNTNYYDSLNSFKMLDSSIEKKGFFDAEWKKILVTSLVFGILGAFISIIKKSKEQ